MDGPGRHSTPDWFDDSHLSGDTPESPGAAEPRAPGQAFGETHPVADTPDGFGAAPGAPAPRPATPGQPARHRRSDLPASGQPDSGVSDAVTDPVTDPLPAAFRPADSRRPGPHPAAGAREPDDDVFADEVTISSDAVISGDFLVSGGFQAGPMGTVPPARSNPRPEPPAPTQPVAGEPEPDTGEPEPADRSSTASRLAPQPAPEGRRRGGPLRVVLLIAILIVLLAALALIATGVARAFGESAAEPLTHTTELGDGDRCVPVGLPCVN